MSLNLSFWRVKKTLSIVIALSIVVGIIFVFWGKSIESSNLKKVISLSEQQAEKLRQLRYAEVSPDKVKNIFIYKLIFNKGLYKDYYDYLESQNIIALEDVKTKHEKYLFIGEERTGDPHWLGNDHVFFTTRCGTDCQGLYLLDTRDQEAKLGVLSYMSDKGFWETVFQDWFGQKFRFPGLVTEVKSETLNAKSYLILQMIDDNEVSLGEKRFLFTDTALIEQ